MRSIRKKNRVVSSRYFRRNCRRITATMENAVSTNEAKRNIEVFIDEIERYLQENESSDFELMASYQDGTAAIRYFVEPMIDGVTADELIIEYDKRFGYYAAYTDGYDEIIGKSEYLDRLRTECYNWLKETLIDLYESIDEEGFIY